VRLTIGYRERKEFIQDTFERAKQCFDEKTREFKVVRYLNEDRLFYPTAEEKVYLEAFMKRKKQVESTYWLSEYHGVWFDRKNVLLPYASTWRSDEAIEGIETTTYHRSEKEAALAHDEKVNYSISFDAFL